ncbi:hypothetical protein ASD83_00740 [Devosia sp. Root685]|uniref:hypothetical protein n=1 Tax=Devosia sp. Root685 TaxID=1736587 RepID=UPI0006F8F316|nr:hypothetical protein [Devosia sp. Root685]KRA99101.1 hypothetical protein ASD83_00740 [Devosia sp. Root685]
MTIKSVLSVAAITVALSGAAFAQGMTINGAAVSETDMPAVQERCDMLATADSTQALSTGSETDTNDNASADDDSATTEKTPGVNESANATSTIDLETIDLQACVDGGFVTQ